MGERREQTITGAHDTSPDGAACQPRTARLADAAERLRLVRRAHERFLALWAVDHLLADPTATARLAAAAASDNPPAGATGADRLFRLGRLDD